MRAGILKRLEDLERRLGHEGFEVVDLGKCSSLEEGERLIAEAEQRVGRRGTVIIVRNLELEAPVVALGSGDRVGGDGLLDGATIAPGPVTPRSTGQRERAQTPPAKHGRNDG